MEVRLSDYLTASTELLGHRKLSRIIAGDVRFDFTKITPEGYRELLSARAKLLCNYVVFYPTPRPETRQWIRLSSLPGKW